MGSSESFMKYELTVYFVPIHMTTYLVGASSSSHLFIQSLSLSRANYKGKQLSVGLRA